MQLDLKQKSLCFFCTSICLSFMYSTLLKEYQQAWSFIQKKKKTSMVMEYDMKHTSPFIKII